ncbi:ATP-dependent helicase [Paenibacillus sp. PAMC 26794]|uniref:UvrD-helicase domain-containing protein n=1 Tax=Paenibacillus sp. PAMC 26794 TaxID=1257080 RepID=UPI00030F4381|nr:ATP-dependent helicase [Paenibacillus sp. PAMC 26794]
MLYTKPEEWTPADGFTLEPAADIAVRQEFNNLILAGPGAGKTELLAQRACFLLQTNLCPSPQKILAISFKADAAENLKKRVELRCGKELAARFESRTFDSFAKQLLDRFRLGIPEMYRPEKDYRLVLSSREVRDIATSYITERHPNLPNWQHEINFNVLYKRLSEDNLPIFEDGQDIYSWILVRLWDILVHGKGELESTLTFPMISKLSDYLLKVNPLINKALRLTYSHVFLDEFQDTTYLQYELVKTIFLGKSTIMTSVGDDKQRIMGWAGALSDAFEQFRHDFKAEQIELTENHRSAPRLIEIQNVLAKIINQNATDAKVSAKHSNQEGLCQVWNFQTHLHEANFVAKSIANRIRQQNISPRDICILVKQQEQVYSNALINELELQGIHARIEKEYQDLIAEDCVQLIIDFIRLATGEKTPDSWTRISEVLIFVNGYDIELDHIKILNMESNLNKHILQLKNDLKQLSDDKEICKQDMNEIVERIFRFVGLEKIFRLHPKYARGNYFERITKDAVEKLTTSYLKHSNWNNGISDFLGLFSVPIMTIHKSKGLEYDTVIFLGLEDDAFWSFNTQRREDMCAFFVALSRAKKQCFFTFSASREILRFRDLQVRRQSNSNISSLYEILQNANVEILNVNNE